MAPTGILYALIARRTVALVEHSSVSGNAPMVALSLLEKVQADRDSKASYITDNMAFHVMVESGLTYLCMSDEAFGKRLPFLFLADVAQLFRQRYRSVAAGAVAYEMSEFAPTLAERAAHYSDPRSDVLGRVRGEVGELKGLMTASIEQVLERGERLELLVEKTDDLGQQTFAFKREARRLRNTMWWRNWRVAAGIVLLVLLALYGLVCVVCSPTFQC